VGRAATGERGRVQRAYTHHFFNEQTRRLRDNGEGRRVVVGVEKEVVLVGNAAGFSAALDSRQAAAKRQRWTGEQRTVHRAV